jgi:hypothetical protein
MKNILLTFVLLLIAPCARAAGGLLDSSGRTSTVSTATVTNFRIGTTTEAVGAITTWVPTITGFSSLTQTTASYFRIGPIVCAWWQFYGTSNATTLTFTLPFAKSNRFSGPPAWGAAYDNGQPRDYPGYCVPSDGSALVNCYLNPNNNPAWTASGAKLTNGFLCYEVL